MSSIKDLYTIVTRSISHGIEGYHVDNKYIDHIKIKAQRIQSSSRDNVKPTKPINVSKKTTFIDEVQKLSAKLPGPSSYEPKEIISKSKTSQLIVHSKRITIFEQMQHLQRKYNFPPPGNYDKITVEVGKSLQRSNISRAENVNYIQGSMRSSLDSPPVGSYNVHLQIFDHRGSKWVSPEENKKNKSQLAIRLPPVGTYNPIPVAYDLFESAGRSHQKKSKSHFNKEQRFKMQKKRYLPFYNVLSQWGMKNRMQKKDILSRISSPNSNRSVYH